MLEFLRRARPAAAAVVLSLSLVACGDDDDPSPDEFSAESAEEMADVAADVTVSAAESEQVQANLFNAFGVLLGAGGGALSPMLPFEVARGAAEPFAAGSIAMPALRDPNGLLIPDAIEGVTFVWSAEDSMYVASDQNGAPDNGARFLVYAVNPLTGYPSLPLTEVGYLDMVDESTEELARLEVRVVRDEDDQTLADYYVQGSVDSTAASTTVSVESEGFYADAERLDFDVAMTFMESETASGLNTSAVLEANGGTITLEHDELDSDAGYESVGTFTIEGEGNEVEFAFVGEGEDAEGAGIEGALSFNGDEVVIFSGPMEDPEFTTPDGGALSGDEIDALIDMWSAFVATYAFTFLQLFPFLLLMALSGF